MKLPNVTRPAIGFTKRLAYSAAKYASAWAKRALYKTLAVFPIPSESKWRGTVELSALLLQTVVKMQQDNSSGESPIASGHHLEWLGEHWMWRRAEFLGFQGPYAPAINSTLITVFKTLDMPTKIKVRGSLITMVTTRCPFLEKAKVNGTAEATCEAVCAEKHSLFRGVANGLPFHVKYHAPYMMGYRDQACVKLLKIVNAPAEGSTADSREREKPKREMQAAPK